MLVYLIFFIVHSYQFIVNLSALDFSLTPGGFVFIPQGESENLFNTGGGGKIGFRFTPGFTLAANAGWQQFSSGDLIQNSGVYAGLTAQISPQTGRGTNKGIKEKESSYIKN